jgi:ubiquinone/menaquinone biosynthesis C-methylase UbiE
MTPNEIDPTEFREGQRQQWNKAATGWNRWQSLIDDAAHGVSERLVELAGVEPGSRVLDVAAGLGEPSLTAARVAGAEGKVVASDISAEMLAFGRNRAEDAGIENIEFVESAAAALDFPADSFDAALSRWGIIFDPDGEGAAARVRGFLADGGRMAISSWGPPDRVPMLGVPMKTVLTLIGADPPPPGTPGPLSRPTPDAIGGLLEGGGFSDVEVEEAEIEMEWQSPEEFTTFVREIAPPITALLAGQPDETRDEAWQAITDAIRQQASEDGTLRLRNLVLMAAGRA